MNKRVISRVLVTLCGLLLLLGRPLYTQSTNPSVVGQWSPLQSWPIVSVHSQMLPTGKVMFYSYTDGPFLWDPATAGISPAAPAGFNLFCTGHSFLPDGRLFVAGGHIENNVGLPNSSIYNPFTNTWTDEPLMNAGRWYPTNTTLPNGDVLVVSGDIDRTVWVNTLPQVFQLASGTWRDLTSAQLALPLYPTMFVAPNGRVFNAGPQQTTRYLDTSGTGAWTFVADNNYGLRDYGPAVMYDVGKILIVGGGDPPTATAEVIDLQAATPRWRNVAPMSVARRQHNATLLPDGTVFVSGGSSGPGWDNADAPVLGTELWNPANETWTPLAPMTQYRGYHSTALLLPDGRVVSSGGDNHPSAEVFSPPYLFKGARPSITSAPSAWSYGQQLDIQTPDAASITAVNLIRLSAVTHTFNQDQRIVRLPFTAGSGVLHATAPSNRNLAPPGPYMLFVLNGNGVPSVGRVMHIADGTVLAAPDQLTAAAASANLVNLSWRDRSTAEDGFRIERAIGTSGTFSVVATIGQDATSYADSTVAPSTSYTYRVVAFNSAASATSTTATVTTPNSTSTGSAGVRRFNGTTDYIDFPSAPQVSTVTIGFFFTPLSLPAAGQRDVLVTYGEQGTAEPFGVNDKQLYLSPDGTLQARVYAGGVAVAASTTKLRVGQRYHVGFTAGTSTLTLYVNGAVESAVATPGSYAGYTDPLLRLAGLPTPVEGGTTSTRANGDITGFGEWRVALTSAQMASLASGAAVTGVQADALVVAASLTNNPPTADVGGPILLNGTTFVATGSSPPAAPTGVTATPISPNRVDLRWTDQSTTEDGFRVLRGVGTATPTTIAAVAANVTSFSDLTVSPSTTYGYAIEAFNSAGASRSATVSATTPATTPSDTAGVRRFNGTTDYIDFPSAPQVNTVTIGFFFTPQSLPATGERDVLVTYGEEGTAEPLSTHDKQLYLLPDGTLKARVWANGDAVTASTTKLVVGQRYHVGFTSSSTTLTVYVNGVAEGAVAAAGSYAGYTDPVLRLAGLPDTLEAGTVNRRANGDVTGVGEWNVALTGAQMASLAAGTAAGSVQASALVVAADLTSDPPAATVGGPVVLNGTTFVTTSTAPPAAPTGLTATPVSSNRVDLRWTDTSSNEDGFRIRRATGTATPTTIATVGANVVTFSDTSASPSTTYSYVIDSFNAAGAASSATVMATTPAGTTTSGSARRFNGTTDFIDFPSAPQVNNVTIAFFFTPLSLPAATERDVLVTYGEQGSAEPFTTHDKQLYLSSDGTLKARVYAGGPAIAASTTKLQVGQRYHVAFTSGPSTLTVYVNGGVEGAIAAAGSYAGYTDPVMRLAGLPGTLDSGTVNARANGDISDVAEWNVALSSAQIASLAAGASATSVQSAALVVAARLTDEPPTADAGGPVVTNGTTLVNSPAPPPPPPPPPAGPAAPTGLTATAVSSRRIDLTWVDRATNESGFHVQRATGSTFSTIANLGPDAASFSDTTVSPNTNYTYRIEVYNASGTALSSTVTVKTPRR